MLAIPRKQRAMVRKGIKRGLRSEIDDGVDRFFELYADNHAPPRHAAAVAGATSRRCSDVFGDDCEVLTVLSPQGKPVSGVLSFYFRDEVLPYYAGDLTDARELAANDFKYWDLMRRACERGLKVFDYGRTKRGTGSFDFKKNWGFEPAAAALRVLSSSRATRCRRTTRRIRKYRAAIDALAAPAAASGQLRSGRARAPPGVSAARWWRPGINGR